MQTSHSQSLQGTMLYVQCLGTDNMSQPEIISLIALYWHLRKNLECSTCQLNLD